MVIGMVGLGVNACELKMACLRVICAAHNLRHALSHGRVSLFILGVGFTRFETRLCATS